MSDARSPELALSELLRSALADPARRLELQELCCRGLIWVEGKRVEIISTERAPGQLVWTPVVEKRYERVPVEDLADLVLEVSDSGCSLSGVRTWYDPSLVQPRRWESLLFHPNNLLLQEILRKPNRLPTKTKRSTLSGRKSKQRLLVERLLGKLGLFPDKGELSFDALVNVLHGRSVSTDFKVKRDEPAVKKMLRECVERYPKNELGRARLKKMIQEIYRAVTA
jgi:hypothetical protein